MLHDARWTTQKIAQRIDLITPKIHRHSHPMPAFRYTALDGPMDTPPVDPNLDDSSWETIEPNSYWGTWFTDFALRTTFEVPVDWDNSVPVALYLPLGEAGDFSHPETLAYIDGEPLAAGDRHHQEIILPDSYRGGDTHQLTLHGWTGLGGWRSGDIGTKLFMRPCAIVQIDEPTRALVAAARVALGIAEELHEDDPARGRLLNALNHAFNILDTRPPLEDDFYESVGPALEALRDGVKEAGAPLDVDIIAIGHAHIDVAWLWTLGHTRRKGGRTFSTVLHLMEEFPEYKFSQSQAQLYQYLEEDYPEMFEQIKERVKEGRWEVMGGTWVEPDCNAIGAESLARQFLLGRNYFRRHFGDVDTPVLWLPDTFGYAWSLPQLIKEAGMEYFVTHKMSWNQFNRMPYQSFWWQGLDGTKVLTHFLTARIIGWGRGFLPYSTTYNAVVTPPEVMGTWRNYIQKETYNGAITAYGYGDGGGGPTRDMLENIQVMNDHAGAPRLRTGTVREFLEDLEEKTEGKLPTWNGEFYLEYHRGTYTSQGRTKRGNRKSEFLLHDAEFVAALANLTSGYDYPQETINKAWELICLNQFHDILPGSSITPVYEDSDKDYAAIREMGESVRDGALDALAGQIAGDFMAVNPTAFGGARVGLLPEAISGGNSLVTGDHTAIVQAVEGGTLVMVPNIDPYSVISLKTSDEGPHDDEGDVLQIRPEGDGYILENELVRVEIDAQGEISRLYDKLARREALAEGEKGNALLSFEDRPLNFDAWDIDIFYDDRMWPVNEVESMTIIENGPVRVCLEIKRRFRSSQIVQKVYLHRHSARIDFDTWIDWHEHHILLKVAFPVNVLNPMATYEIQWGNVERPTHRNTSWDWARFETCAYKWVDLSEGNYGVSLLNDCKHGHDIQDHTMRLTLLKSATSPDPDADQGEHLMTYSILPHSGDWREGTVAHAYHLNDPLILRRADGGTEEALAPFVSVDVPNVIIETVKKAENGNGIIVRLYEYERNRGSVTLKAGFPLASAAISNIMEEDQESLAIDGNSVTFEITPYKIMTLRLVPQA